MAKRQVLKNQITWKGNSYEIVYRVDVDGMEREIGKFQAERLEAIIALRELVANLPTLQAKLEAIANLKDWFHEQLRKIDERVKKSKTKTSTKKAKSEEDKDKVLRDFLAKLGK